MKRAYLRALCVGLGALLFTSGVQAAVISPTWIGDFNPETDDFVNYFGYTPEAYRLTWDTSGGNLAPSDFDPTNNPQYGPAGGNPSWLNFNTVSSGGGGATPPLPTPPAGGGGGTPDPTGGNAISTFTLGNNLGGPWSMDFSVLIFDEDFDDDATMDVFVIGEDWSDPFNIRTTSLDATEVQGGKMLTWHIEGDAGEEVTVSVRSLGDESYAAGFFMGNANMQVPEPATMALLTAGLCGVLAARRRRSLAGRSRRHGSRAV